MVRTAAILSDADLLSSVGLGEAWHEVQIDRLQQEIGRPIDPAENPIFIEHVVGPGFLSPGGLLLAANLEHIGAQVRRLAAASANPG